MRLTRSSVKRYLDASAETHAVRRNHNGTRAELDRLRHILECFDGKFHLVPLLLLDAEQKLHKVGANREVAGVARNDKGFELRHLLARWLQRLRDKRDDVVAQRIHLGVQLDGGNTLSKVDDRSARVLLDYTFRLLDDG